MLAWHEVLLTHVKWRQPLNEDVFEANVLHFFIVSFKRFLRWAPFGVFLQYLLKFKHFVDFFPYKMWLQISVFVARVCAVYLHWIKTSLKLSLALFISAIFERWQVGTRSLSSFLFSLCWGLNRLKCDGSCLFLCYCDSCFASEGSFLTGKECPRECEHCRSPHPKNI